MRESELVERLVAIGWRGSRSVILGPGDDAAVLRGGLVLSTDLAVEGVHFRLDWISAEEAGFRAGAAALSDLAAMGATPEGMLVSLAVPGDGSVAADIQRGIRSAGDRVAASIIGGDVSRSPGPVVVDVVVAGRARPPVRRSGAVAGHEVWVSGALGGSAAALEAWSAGARPDALARARFAQPPDRVPLGTALASARIARSMIDTSDGLVADARRIAAASGVRIRIVEGRVPAHPGTGGDLNLALQGGEDYELMFTAPARAEDRILAIAREVSVPLTRIGTVEEGTGVVLEDAQGRRTTPGPGGFDHFADPGSGRAP